MSNRGDLPEDWFGENISETDCSDHDLAVEGISELKSPLVLRNFVENWPVVNKAKQSNEELVEYLLGFDRGAVVPVSLGRAEADGRVFYNDEYTDLNVKMESLKFSLMLDRIIENTKRSCPNLIYMASVDTEECLPGFSDRNLIEFGDRQPLISIWIGTKTRIAAHNDLPQNIACVAAGIRRFTLFPPHQTKNLYAGSFEWTPASRPVSLVDFYNPDFDTYPRFKDAMAEAKVAILEPGDALYIPSMWWHHVEAEGGLNVLVNYWWRDVPRFLGTPQDVLIHGMMTLRDMPTHEKQIWKDLFEYYVFGDKDLPAEHVPEIIQGVLGPIDSRLAQRTRAYLVSRLNR